MPMSIAGSRSPMSIPTRPGAPSPTPVPYPNVSQNIEDTESHGDSDSFQVQKDVENLKEHGSEPKSHGDLPSSIQFPEPRGVKSPGNQPASVEFPSRGR